jgi:hypothetical protein
MGRPIGGFLILKVQRAAHGQVTAPEHLPSPLVRIRAQIIVVSTSLCPSSPWAAFYHLRKTEICARSQRICGFFYWAKSAWR